MAQKQIDALPNSDPSALTEDAAGVAGAILTVPTPDKLVGILYDDTTTRAQRFDAIQKAIERLSEQP